MLTVINIWNGPYVTKYLRLLNIFDIGIKMTNILQVQNICLLQIFLTKFLFI